MNALNTATTKTIPAWDVRHQMEQGNDGLVVDVRTPVEFRAVHAEGAINVPLDTLGVDALRAMQNTRGGAPIYFICRTGARAKTACERLANAGATGVFVVEGGTEAWEQAGFPVIRGKKAVSLERQVRIAAGSLVAIGSLLAAFVNSWFWILPAFVGSGLTFAGITDTCAMGMLLARMPWNKGADPACQA
jgi:rhodanese-related sulfurtransferase